MQGYDSGCCGWDGNNKRRKGAIVKVMVVHRCKGGGGTTINKNITTFPIAASSYNAAIAANEPRRCAQWRASNGPNDNDSDS
jgi:hypothetical protein